MGAAAPQSGAYRAGSDKTGATVALISVNAGTPRLLGVRKGQEIHSAIDKHPVTGAVEVELRADNLEGDAQSSTSHGGPDMKLYAYPVEHLHSWADEYGRAFPPGRIGENLTVAGWDEQTVCIGDVWSWGEATIQVSQPRSPCYKLAMQMGLPDLPRRFERRQRCGWYLRILGAGSVPLAGPIVVVERDAASISVATAQRAARWDGGLERASIEAVAAHPALGASWRVAVERRLARLDGAVA